MEFKKAQIIYEWLEKESIISVIRSWIKIRLKKWKYAKKEAQKCQD